jgi:hypothetical protein
MRIAHSITSNTSERDRLATVLALPSMLQRVDDLDALHDQTCDNYDVATRDLDAAREEFARAKGALRIAESIWSDAGAEMNAAAVALSQACRAAGVVRTAEGYRPAVQA